MQVVLHAADGSGIWSCCERHAQEFAEWVAKEMEKQGETSLSMSYEVIGVD